MEYIDRKSFQIKIVGGKGNKDRFTLLPKELLTKWKPITDTTAPNLLF
jgi:hypothetical protein